MRSRGHAKRLPLYDTPKADHKAIENQALEHSDSTVNVSPISVLNVIFALLIIENELEIVKSIHCRILCDMTSCYSRSDALRITWKHRALPDVVKIQVQHDNTFKTYSPSAMGWCSEAE